MKFLYIAAGVSLMLLGADKYMYAQPACTYTPCEVRRAG